MARMMSAACCFCEGEVDWAKAFALMMPRRWHEFSISRKSQASSTTVGGLVSLRSLLITAQFTRIVRPQADSRP